MITITHEAWVKALEIIYSDLPERKQRKVQKRLSEGYNFEEAMLKTIMYFW